MWCVCEKEREDKSINKSHTCEPTVPYMAIVLSRSHRVITGTSRKVMVCHPPAMGSRCCLN